MMMSRAPGPSPRQVRVAVADIRIRIRARQYAIGGDRRSIVARSAAVRGMRSLSSRRVVDREVGRKRRRCALGGGQTRS